MPTHSMNRNRSRARLTRSTSRPRSLGDRWSIILAGGDGARLRSMTYAISGDDRPKQFCPVIGGRTLLDQTRDRVQLSAPGDKTLIVVTEKHRRYYQPLSARLPRELLVVQPQNKGTAPAILYALLRIAAKSPKAIVGLFPSDHFFADDAGFMAHVDRAYDGLQTRPEMVTLLGITPESPETEYGWIEPQQSTLGCMPGSITRVQRFWEKPAPTVARNLMERGCLWNSFVMVGRVDALLEMTRRALGEFYGRFAAVAPSFSTRAEPAAIRELYMGIPETNFSHQVLAVCPQDLAVMRVGEVGWSDLGEPARVLATLSRIGVETGLTMSAS